MIFLCNSYRIHSLVKEEIYYAGDKQRITAVKKYIYDVNNNIIETVVEYDNGTKTGTRYTYQSNLLITAEEYHETGSRMKYSVFYYDDKRLIKRIDYSTEEKPILTSLFFYDDNRKIIKVTEEGSENRYFGKREFIYKNNKLMEEIQYSPFDEVQTIKKYKYKNNLIDEIILYVKDNKVRIIQRVYNSVEGNESPFGFRDNYWNIK